MIIIPALKSEDVFHSLFGIGWCLECIEVHYSSIGGYAGLLGEQDPGEYRVEDLCSIQLVGDDEQGDQPALL